MNWFRQEAVKTNIPLYSRLMRSLSMVKTGHMSFNCCSLIAGDEKIVFSELVRNLCVILDSQLTMND
jgi:hypothetical protein